MQFGFFNCTVGQKWESLLLLPFQVESPEYVMFLLAQKLIIEPNIYYFKNMFSHFFLYIAWGLCSFYFSRVQIWVVPRLRNIFHEKLWKLKKKKDIDFGIWYLHTHTKKKLLGDYA